jgi:hypothetical protein
MKAATSVRFFGAEWEALVQKMGKPAAADAEAWMRTAARLLPEAFARMREAPKEDVDRIWNDVWRCVEFVKRMEEEAGECPWRELLREEDAETALGFAHAQQR